MKHRNKQGNKKRVPPAGFLDMDCDGVGDNAFRPEEIALIMKDPQLRMSDNPHNCALASILVNNPEDPHLQDLFRVKVQEHWAQTVQNTDPFWPNYPPKGSLSQSSSMIIAGRMGNGDVLAHPLHHVHGPGNTGLIGASRRGKTSFAKQFIRQAPLRQCRVVAIDKKDELRDLATTPDLAAHTTVLLHTEIPLCFRQPPPGVRQTVWDDELTNLIANSYARWAAQRVMREELAKMPQQGNRERYETLKDVADSVDGLRQQRYSIEGRYIYSIGSVLRDMVHSDLGQIFSYVYSDFLEHVFSTPGLLIISAGTLHPDHYEFLVSFMVRWLYLRRLGAGEGKSVMPVTLFLDDLTAVIDRQREARTAGGTTALDEVLFMSQGLGIAVIWAGHTLTMSEKIIRNTLSLYFFGLQGEDSRKIQNLLGMTTPEQTEMARVLTPGQLVALIPHRWPLPVFATFDEPKMTPRLGDAQRKATANALLSRVKVVRAIVPSPSTKKDTENSEKGTGTGQKTVPVKLESKEREVLIQATTGAVKTVTELYASTGMNRTKGRKIVVALEAKGLVSEHSFSTGRVGGQIKFLEVTATGEREVRRAGLLPRRMRTQGGWEHNLAAILVGARGRENGMSIEYEVDLEGVRIDVVWHNKKNGQKVFHNIGVSDVAREAESIIKALRLPVIEANSFVLVARDSLFRKKLNKRLGKRDADALSKIDVKLVADFVGNR